MKTMNTPSVILQTSNELSIVRYINGKQIAVQNLSMYTVVSPTISRVIQEANKRACKSVTTNDIGAN